ncbi:MAG: FCD domain-containing protein [Acetobacteraceae bacterium]
MRRAIAAGDGLWEDRLVAAHHRVARTPERDAEDPSRPSDAWMEANHAFHRALVSGGDSPWLVRLWDLLFAQGERYRRLSVPLARSDRDIAREHRDILAAALARDADRTVALLVAHLERTSAIVLDAGLCPCTDGRTHRGLPDPAKKSAG